IGIGRRPKRTDYEKTRQALKKVRLESFQQRPIQALSGGQWQRLLLARALSCEPRILLLDEPTTAIDPEGSESLYELLLALREQGTTIIIVSHDVGVIAQYADRIACLNRTIICHDRPEEVISAESLKEMYGKEAAFFHHGEIPHIVVKKTTTPCYQPREEKH
ncbi:MAG: ATP-binding cassette domain-containing protein, partial [Atribacterota bacterium]|nr:ATP-binding cassette domain-containing protein [Atribacterota bacterium]